MMMLNGCTVSQESLEQITGYTAPVVSDPTLTGLSMSVVGGNFQIAAPSASFSDPLKIQLLNNGQPLVGKSIDFTFTTGITGTLSSISATTDSSGMAQVNLTAGSNSGTIGIKAIYQSASVNFSGTIIDQSGVSLDFFSPTGNNQTALVNQNYTNPLSVLVTRDSTGAPAPNIIVSFVVTSGNSKINGTTNTLNVTTDALGIASVNLQAGTIAGPDTVKAVIATNPAEFVTFNETSNTSISLLSLASSTIFSTLGTLVTNGADTTTITFTLKDSFGNIISSPPGTVIFSANKGTLIGSVTNVGDGRYTQTWRAPLTGSGTNATISGTYSGTAIPSTVSISLVAGTHSISNSTITSSPINVTADGTSYSVITLTLKDPLGNQLTTGISGAVTFSKTGLGTLIGSVNNVGDGTYTQVFRSTTATGTGSVTATVDGAALGSSTTVNFLSGPASPTLSTLATTQSILPPNDSAMALITLTTRDANGNLRGSSIASAPVVTFTTTLGTMVGSPIDNGDGTFQQYIKSSVSGTTTIRAVIDGVATTNSLTMYFNNQSSQPSTNFSLVSIVGGSSYIPADGTTSISVKATIKTASNIQFTSGGNTVAFSTTAGTWSGPIMDNGDGTYTRTLIAPSSAAANVVISATVDGMPIVSTASVNFYGTISLATSTMSVTYPNIEATGATTTIIILQAKDANGVAIPVGGTTGITFQTTAGTLLTSVSDNGNGTYTQTLQSAAVSSIATVSAKLNTSDFSATKNVTFFTANNWAGLTMDCTADDGLASIGTAPTSISKRIRLWGNNIVVDNGTLTMNTRSAAGYCPSSFVFGNVNVRNNGFITHTAISTGTQAYALEFSSDSLSVDGTSSINSNAKGLKVLTAANYRVVTGTSSAPVFADSTISRNGSTLGSQSGGSYGGEGFSYSNAANGPSATYGSLFEPNDPGSASVGSQAITDSSAAGGVVKISVSGIANINGSVSSNGSSSIQGRCGQGSGGSVWLNVGTLQGTGTVTSLGGNAMNGCTYYNPGGGGRIAIYYSTLAGNFSYGSNLIANVRAYGGYVWNATTTGGAAGTIYLKSTTQTYGDLLVNNNNITNTGGAATTIRYPSISTPDSVTSNTITKTNHFKELYKSDCALKNWFVHSNTSENATATRLDDTYFKITSCDADTISISSGSLTAAPLNANTSSNFELFMIFDHFEVAGKSQVDASHIVSLEGSISDQTQGLITGSMNSGLGFEFDQKSLIWDAANLHAVGNPASLNNAPFRYSDKNITLSNGHFNFSNTLVAGGLTLSGSTLNSFVPRGTQSITLSGALNVTNSSTLTHQAVTNVRGGTEYWLDVDAASLNVDSTSSVNVTGKGYSGISNVIGCTVYGNQLVNTGISGQNAGGSHGGYGDGFANTPYGSVTNPDTFGAACVWGAVTIVSGGGVARFHLGSGTALIDGNIQADANTGGTSGSAGGSIYLDVGYLNGTGFLSANGKAGPNSAGGGGRIAVHYNSSGGNFSYPGSFISNVRTFGAVASGFSTRASSAGTIFARNKSNIYGDLIINNNGIIPVAGRGAAVISPVRSTISTLATNSITYSSGSNFQEFGLNSNWVEGFAVVPNVSEVATSTLNDHTYFPISSVSGANITSSVNGITSIAANGSISAFPFVVNNLQLLNGGTLYLTENMIVRNGDLTSNDTTTFIADGGTTGAGKIELPGVTQLSISQSGSAQQPAFSPITSGATSLTLGTNSNLTFTSATTINGPVTLNNNSALTINAPTTISGLVTLNSTTQMTVNSPLTVNNNVTMNNTTIMSLGSASYSPNFIVSGDISLNDTSQIKGIASTQTVPRRMYITAANINIAAGAKITTDALGGPIATGTSPWVATSGAYYPNSETAMATYGTTYRTTSSAGYTSSDGAYANAGSYGGLGGDNTANITLPGLTAAASLPFGTYGNLFSPVEPGIGGGAWNGNSGTPGGGAIRLNVTGTITNNGKITANGSDNNLTGRVSTGSGGGILINTNTLTGTGNITANGGGQNVVTDYATGGGGRIAIYYTSATGNFATSGANPAVLSNVLATGGNGSTNSSNLRTGAAGTIYLKSTAQTYGDLIINNAGYTTSAATYFDAPTPSTITSITSSGTNINKTGQFGYGTLWKGINLSLPNKWENFYVNPNTAQNSTTRLNDDTAYKIISSSADTIVTNADVSATASSGNTFKLMLIFDHLEVRQKGNLYAPNLNIRVISGDLSSGSSTTFNQDGLISAGVVDVGTATWNTTANATGSSITNRCGVAGTSITINCP